MGEGTWVSILLVTKHRFFSNLWVWMHLNGEEWVKFHVDMMLTCRIYLNHRQWLWPFCMSISGSVIFRGCRFNLLCNIGGGLEKCYIVLHRVGGPKIRFVALYNMRTAPLSLDISSRTNADDSAQGTFYRDAELLLMHWSNSSWHRQTRKFSVLLFRRVFSGRRYERTRQHCRRKRENPPGGRWPTREHSSDASEERKWRHTIGRHVLYLSLAICSNRISRFSLSFFRFACAK